MAAQLWQLRRAGERLGMPPELDLAAVLGVLSRHGVRFILIGGMASVVHGSPFPTADVDITPEETDENLARLSQALRELNATVRATEVDEPLPFRIRAPDPRRARVGGMNASRAQVMMAPHRG